MPMSDFLLGILVALLPSMLTVTWLIWRAVLECVIHQIRNDARQARGIPVDREARFTALEPDAV